ncbi:MAG: Mur ligase domain-containing protein [Sediminibacterium sp.]|jgi:UDP-N-acetylmuramate: L-alanyl-gamma-D-glutamyl-meso-diaminopimelate ligase|nr:Mur ligase domain-containing protein [Sediminibacterium sp.]
MKVHFISIGGSVMHQLAIALQGKGYQVTGTDDEIFEPALTHLRDKGLLPSAFGWQPDLITSDLDAVILGMHAKADNPELIKAQELGLSIYSFPEYIFHESQQKKRVVVGGSHGKTTTTSMIMHVLKTCHQDFDYLVGAKLAGFEQSVKVTNAPTIVCEGDEYLASALLRQPKFHFLFPHVAILTGIAWDHINVFPTFEFYLEQFVIFMKKIEAGGVLIYNETDEVLNKLVLSNKRDNIRYIPYKVPAHQISNGQTYITIDGAEGPLSVFGDHNLLNMQAAYYACAELGITAQNFVHAMANFTGASKRLELLANNEHCNIYRDFAHAPSKVIATIEAVKQQFPSRKLIGVLELHTYSSLNKEFMHQYKGALEKTDTAVVFYSKHALQIKGLPELPESYVVEGFDKNGLLVMTDKTALEQWLRKQDYSNTNLVLMSSGNYDGIDLPSFAPTLI